MEISSETAYLVRQKETTLEGLTILIWVQIVSAVFMGCLLFALCAYSYWAMQKAQDETGDSSRAPFHVFFCGAIGPIIMAVGVYLLA